jgi:hypothetical protein
MAFTVLGVVAGSAIFVLIGVQLQIERERFRRFTRRGSAIKCPLCDTELPTGNTLRKELELHQ